MQAWYITHLSYHIITEVNLSFFDEGKKCNMKIEKYIEKKKKTPHFKYPANPLNKKTII